MDTSDPKIHFTINGACNHCTEFLAVRSKYCYNGKETDEALLKLIARIKTDGKGKKYDCVVGLSGGIDSTYTAYLAKEKGLRILGVHMDNGWDSQQAVLNIENLARKLEIDYLSYVLDWEEFKKIQLAFLKASVPEVETPTDIAIMAALHEVAARNNINYILSGGNFATEGILPKFWHYNAKDVKYFSSIYKRFGNGRLKKFRLFGSLQETYFKLVKGINIVYWLNYFPYKKDATIEFLQKELNWTYHGGKHHESIYTSFIHSYYLVKKFGIDYRRATLSSQICAGEMSRDEALEAIKTKPFNEEKVERDKVYIAKKLGVSLQEFDNILALPPRWYTDYPNNEKKLGLIYAIYRKLYKKEKLSSV
jgi:N-acetyl sugar amidotransferase